MEEDSGPMRFMEGSATNAIVMNLPVSRGGAGGGGGMLIRLLESDVLPEVGIGGGGGISVQSKGGGGP